ncbi:hypothetical protein TcYC6_0097580 [Trypanosoma cruzi]|nr:hypothetical protein TcYC6_0097580 [Trypanosoma cruzi]
MDTGRSICPSRTLPLKGVQHITSPSVPSVVLGNKHLPQLPYKPIVCGEDGSIFTASLREIGPSACTLINSQRKGATQKVITKSNSGKMSKNRREGGMETCVASKAATVGHSKAQASPLMDASGDDLQRSRSPHLQSTQFEKLYKNVAVNALSLSKKMNQTYSGTMDMLNSMTLRSTSRDSLPPLVNTLERYIYREMDATLSRGSPLTVQDRLQPFREAFFAIIDALPAYGNILNDIMSVYDGVIQEQAKLLADIITEHSQRNAFEQQNAIELAELRSTVSNLMKELEKAQNAANEETLPVPSNDWNNKLEPRLQRATRTRHENEKELQDAQKKIKEMGEVIKSELEKQLVLINSLRESDKRTKSLEVQLSCVNSQMDELSEFKVMAGEAQKQLEEFKLKYQNFISVQDHEIIRDYLKGELQAAQNTARQYRRAAAVRGTQVDVIDRKLKAIQKENKELLEAVEDGRKEILTPRPDWKKIHLALPELKDIAAPVKSISLEGDEAITSNVGGLTETRLQVEFLVESINSLSRELQRRKMVLMPTVAPTLPLIGQGVESHVPLHLRACGIIPRVSLDPVEILLLVHDFFGDVLQPHPDVLLHTLDVPALYKEFLRERIKKREAFNGFVGAEHLAINIADFIKDKERARPSFLLLDGILSGIFPARIACDVMMIVENVRFELTSLSKGQKKTRLRRVAISDCIAPVLQLKTMEEITALKDTMGSDTTHDVESLCATEGKFMSTLFDQECASGMKFYVGLLEKLTSYSHYRSPESTELVISLESVGRAIAEMEPLTPKVIIKEITEKPNEGSKEDGETIIGLSDAIHLLAAAPVIRRSVHPKANGEVL